MELRVLLAINMMLSGLLAGCLHSEKKVHLNSKNPYLSMESDILHYEEQPFTGMLYQLYENSKDTLFIQNYEDGKANGVWKKYYPHHKIYEIRYFDAGEKTGTLKTWWPNGNLQTNYQFKNGEYHGNCKTWNKQGKLIQDMNYVKGYELGQQRIFYDNGKVRTNYYIINGRRFGLLGTKNCINVSDSIFKK